MALETVFLDLCTQCQKLHETVSGLRLTIIEDKPLYGDVVLIDALGNATEDTLGWLEEMYAAAADGRQAVHPPLDLERARHALMRGHERFNHLMQRLFLELLCYDRIAELLSVGRERRGEWRSWTSSVKEALDSCRQPLFDVNQAFLQCWREIGERGPLRSLSV